MGQASVMLRQLKADMSSDTCQAEQPKLRPARQQGRAGKEPQHSDVQAEGRALP